MKVKVHVKSSDIQAKYYEQVITEAYAEMEAMFQENRDLRLSESRLRDELNIVRQQSEARRQIICERDRLIQGLNDQIAADEEEIHAQYVEKREWIQKYEELETEIDACHHNIDGYIESNRRMRAEYEKKMEAEQDQTKYWHKKHDEVFQKMEGYKTQLIVVNQDNLDRAKAMEQLQEEYYELEVNFDELERVHKLWGEEIDHLRKVITNLQANRSAHEEFIKTIMNHIMPSTDQ